MTDYVTTAQIADRLNEGLSQLQQRAAFDAWLPGAIERGWYQDTHIAWWAWQHQQREIDRLRSVIAEAVEDVESWAAYADPYFQQKHDLAGCIAKYKNALLPNV